MLTTDLILAILYLKVKEKEGRAKMEYETLINKLNKAAKVDQEAAYDAAATALQDAGLIDVEDTGVWVKNANPADIARVVKQSGLNLDCEYILVPDSGMYNQFIEADTITELFTNNDMADMLEDLDDYDKESLAEDLEQISKN